MSNDGVFIDACGFPRDVSGEFSVTFKGFKTLKDAELFISWLGESGEQDAYYWFQEQGQHLYGTCGVKDVVEGNNITSTLYASPKNEDDLEE